METTPIGAQLHEGHELNQGRHNVTAEGFCRKRDALSVERVTEGGSR